MAAFFRQNVEQENITITQFENMGLSKELMNALTKMKFDTPTPVQEAAIVPMMSKQDLLVQAPTGTGKTGAFGIPVIEGIDTESNAIQSIILSPTRELAIQITTVMKQLTAYKHGIRILTLYGGEPIHRQIMGLRRRPQIIVATPGRLMDHIRRRTVRMDNVNSVVLDEADRMLDMGFREDMEVILQQTPDTRQTVLFSATFSKAVCGVASAYQKDAQRITIKQDTLTVDRVEQYYSEIRGKAKTQGVLKLLQKNDFTSPLIFVATKAMADNLSRELNENGYKADALHGDLRQKQRDIVMDKYRKRKVHILVATDVAARGIDVSDIDVVINYDIPDDHDSYIHRIGRTGRASKSGLAYTLIYPKERGKLQGIIKATKASILPFPLLPNDGKEKRSDYGKSTGKPTGRFNNHNSKKPSDQKHKKPYRRKPDTVQAGA